MNKTSLSLILLAVSAFGQDNPVFKEFFDRAVSEGQKNAMQIEQLLPVRDKAFTDLSAALNDPTPNKVREAFDRAWDAELKMSTLVFACKSDAEQVRDNAKTALEYKQIYPQDSADGVRLADRLQMLAKQGEPNSQQIALHAQMFAYSLKESGRVMANLKKSVDERKKAAEELAKKVNGADKVKTEVYAGYLLKAHTSVMAVAAQENELVRLLWHAEYYFKDGGMTEKQYDKTQQVVAKLKAADEMKWAPKEQVAIYKQAGGDVVEFVMK